MNWNLRNSGISENLLAVQFGQGQFVAVGGWTDSGRILCSPDGVTWTQRDSRSFPQLVGISYGGGRFVACSSSAVRISFDGNHWIAGAIPKTGLTAITYGNNLFVSVGSSGVVLTSPDGITWQSISLGSTKDFTSVTFGDGKFVAVGRETIFTSTNGTAWTNVTPAGSTDWLGSVGYGAGCFVTAGYRSSGLRSLLTSADGISWTSRASGNTTDRYNITYRNGQFISGGYNSTVLRSSNGATWSSETNSQISYRSNWAFGNGVYVSCSPSPEGTYSSTDGESWVYRSSNGTDVVFADGKFTVIDSLGNARISTNGVNWSIQASGLPGKPKSLFRLIHNRGRYTAMSSSVIMTSENGINWTTRYTAATDEVLREMTLGNNTIVVSASVGSDASRYLISPDGLTWIANSFSFAAPIAMTYGDGYFVGVSGAGLVVSSPDGIKWTLQNSGAGGLDLTDVVYGNGQFVAVGDAGAILTATPTGGGPPPVITSLPYARAIEGRFFSHAVEASNSPAVFEAENLPSGLVLNAVTGTISGVAPSPGRYVISLTAINAFGRTTEGFALDVLDEVALQSVNPKPQPVPLRAVIHDGQRFVAVGDTGTISVSTDGTSWTDAASAISSHLNGIAFGSGKYVAVGNDGALVLSYDGLHWEGVVSPTSRSLQGVTFGNSLFVAVGDKGALVTSTDGRNWNRPSIPVSLDFTAVAFVGGQFIALCSTSSGLLTSTDGLTWTIRNLPYSSYATLSGIAYGNGRYVIVGQGSNSWFSLDGTTWSLSSGLVPCNSVIFANNQFVAAGTNGAVYTSPTGEAWTSSTTNLPIRSVAFGSGRFLAVGMTGAILSSSDGIAWNNLSTSYSGLRGIAFAHGLYVAVGGNTFLTSPDGEHWTPRKLDSISIYTPLATVAYGADRFVALAGTAIYTSLDGLTWSASGILPSPMLTANDLIFDNGSFVAVGKTGAICTSLDGLNWTARTSGTSEELFSVSYRGGQYVSVGSKSTILTSPDAISWTSHSSSTSTDLYGVTIGNGVYIAIGLDGVILRSTDAINWAPVAPPFPVTMRSIAFGGGEFLAFGDGAVFRSTDGLQWVASATGTTLLQLDVLWDGSGFVSVGGGGTIQRTSGNLQTPIIGFTSSPKGTVGVDVEIIPEIGNNPSGFSAVGLPPGLGIEAQTGRISGRPTSAGSYLATVSASNDSGTTDARITVTISNWITQQSGLASNLMSVTYGNGQFLATGYSGKILSSTDGIHWIERASNVTSIIRDIIYQNGNFIAVGSSGKILTSSDGISWTAQTSGTTWGLSSIAWGGNQYVAVGELGAVLTSPDGSTWTTRNPGLTHTFYAITYGANVFVAVTTSGYAFRSSNGVDWTYTNTGSTNGISSVTYGNGMFIGVCSGKFITSPDGITWNSQVSAGWLTRIRYSGRGFLAVGGTLVQPQSLISTSLDGVHWNSSLGDQASQLQDVAAGNGILVAVGNGGVILTSYAPFITSPQTAALTSKDPLFSYQIGTAVGASSYTATGLPPGLSLDTTTGLITGLPEAPGIYNVTIGASKGEIVTTETLSLSVPSLYDWWKGRNYTETELADSSISGANADTEGDGIPNLLEFALGLDPWTPDAECLPKAEITTVDGNDYLAIRFSRPRHTAEVNCLVETCSKPDFKTSDPAIQVGLPMDDENRIQSLFYRDNIPTSNTPQRFIRLRMIKAQ